ncbi:hypothetical protein INT43_003417 [Umbelopsis isabellina]|uniref:C2H2-type domain-containing protein n=1 Tax=Mortierella isabellina TaxID=91625 RepID=A0A8H7UGA7_MORIS|nr:hypothetical protein INT43_003417 [Umbelopsis isabellina]
MISLGNSMNYNIGYQNAFSHHQQTAYAQRRNVPPNIEHHQQLPNSYPHRLDIYTHTDVPRPSPFPLPNDSSKQVSIYSANTTPIKEIQNPYQRYNNAASQRISVASADAHSRKLSRSSDGCMYDPTPTCVNTSSEPLPHLISSQQYIGDYNRPHSDDTSSTSSGTGDSQMLGRQAMSTTEMPVVLQDSSASHIHNLYQQPIGHIPLSSQPSTPIVGRWRSMGPTSSAADTSYCDVLYEKLPYARNNSLNQMYATRAVDTDYYPRTMSDKNEKPILNATSTGWHDDDGFSRPNSPAENMTDHTPKHVYNGSKQYPGANLMSTFSTKVMSSVPKRYRCSVCSKRFTRPSSLTTHMYSHTGEVNTITPQSESHHSFLTRNVFAYLVETTQMPGCIVWPPLFGCEQFATPYQNSWARKLLRAMTIFIYGILMFSTTEITNVLDSESMLTRQTYSSLMDVFVSTCQGY